MRSSASDMVLKAVGLTLLAVPVQAAGRAPRVVCLDLFDCVTFRHETVRDNTSLHLYEAATVVQARNWWGEPNGRPGTF